MALRLLKEELDDCEIVLSCSFYFQFYYIRFWFIASRFVFHFTAILLSYIFKFFVWVVSWFMTRSSINSTRLSFVWVLPWFFSRRQPKQSSLSVIIIFTRSQPKQSSVRFYFLREANPSRARCVFFLREANSSRARWVFLFYEKPTQAELVECLGFKV